MEVIKQTYIYFSHFLLEPEFEVPRRPYILYLLILILIFLIIGLIVLVVHGVRTDSL